MIDDDWVASGCVLDAASKFDGNRFYSSALSTSGTFDFSGNAAGNFSGAEDGASFAQDARNSVNGSGEDASHFVRPEWGIYRSLLDLDNLRPDEEDMRFANFSVQEVMLAN